MQQKEEKKQALSIYEISEIYEWVSIISQDGNVSHDYGDGKKYTSVEVHTISYIGEHPGCTVTEISRNWMKTKSAVSQIIKKLIKQNLVIAEVNKDDEKQLLLRLTPEGKMLDAMHRKFDEISWRKSMEVLRKRFSEEEINNTFLVLQEWAKWRVDYPEAVHWTTILEEVYSGKEKREE